MPIYEFYCADCHIVYQFLSRRINTRKRPDCPRCGKQKLSREVSRFAITGKAEEKTDNLDDLPFDETKMMNALASLEGEAEKINEDDPRQAADLMRKFASMTDMPLGGAMEEALGRMEAGEDPESIEKDMGDRLDNEDPFQMPTKAMGAIRRLSREPGRDPAIYDM